MRIEDTGSLISHHFTATTNQDKQARFETERRRIFQMSLLRDKGIVGKRKSVDDPITIVGH